MQTNIQLISFLTILRKESNRFFRIWPQTFLPSITTSALYLLIFGKFLGGNLRLIEGMPYINYIVPGLVMLSVLINSYTNTVTTFFSSKFQRSIEEILISPTSYTVIILGYSISGAIRGIISGLLVMCLAFFCTNLLPHNIFACFIVAIFAAHLFSLIGLINGIYAKKFDDTALIPTFVITPLTYLGGVFYPISILPEIWQKIIILNPITHIIKLFKFGFLGAGYSQFPIGALIILVILNIALFSFAYYLLNKGIGMRR